MVQGNVTPTSTYIGIGLYFQVVVSIDYVVCNLVSVSESGLAIIPVDTNGCGDQLVQTAAGHQQA